MTQQRLTNLEMQVMEVLWNLGPCAVREIQEAFPRPWPTFTTIQTTVYRLENKQAVRIVKRIGKANIFEAVVSRGQAQTRLVDELFGLFGGRAKPVMAHLIETGKLSMKDIKEAEETFRQLKSAKVKQGRQS